MSNAKSTKSSQAQGKPKREKLSTLCPWQCDQIPNNVPNPGRTQEVLHPHKDVFVLKVAKIGARGDRKCKVELELVTPKGPERKPMTRLETREAQCDPDHPPCCCSSSPKK